MMYWGNGIGGWGMVLMTVGNLLFWGLVISGVVVLVRLFARGTQRGGSSDEAATPQRVLAERFVRGEIDEDEYRQRLHVLNTAPRARAPAA